jgi:hypothetical protein
MFTSPCEADFPDVEHRSQKLVIVSQDLRAETAASISDPGSA